MGKERKSNLVSWALDRRSLQAASCLRFLRFFAGCDAISPGFVGRRLGLANRSEKIYVGSRDLTGRLP